MIPIVLILRALSEKSTDRDIYERLTAGVDVHNTLLTDRIELLLKSSSDFSHLTTRQSCLEYIGSKFHVMLDSPEDYTQEQAGRDLLNDVCLVHLDNDQDKYELLMFMIQKLYALSAGDCAQDNPDSPQHQEILLGGHLYVNYMKEKMQDILYGIKIQIRTDMRRTPALVDFTDSILCLT